MKDFIFGQDDLFLPAVPEGTVEFCKVRHQGTFKPGFFVKLDYHNRHLGPAMGKQVEFCPLTKCWKVTSGTLKQITQTLTENGISPVVYVHSQCAKYVQK